MQVQYVALRNINLIVQKRPDILKHEMKVFFVKYNDPIYVKLEKLDIMIRLASQANIAQVLSELKEWVIIFLGVRLFWSVLLTQYCAGVKIEKNEMGWACGAYGWGEGV